MGIITLIINALTGGVAKELAAAFTARETAKTDAARIAADERINRLQNIRDIQIAEAPSRINSIMRFFIALGPALYLFKIYVFDKVVCQIFGWTSSACRTDDLTTQQWTVVSAVIGFYFLYELGMGATKIIARRK